MKKAPQLGGPAAAKALGVDNPEDIIKVDYPYSQCTDGVSHP